MNTVTYLYPDKEDPNGLIIFQETTSQIRGFSFKKSRIVDVKKQKYAGNASVYFLLSEDEDGFKRIYIGKSANGIDRIENHRQNKAFWQRCFMFVTDNASFHATSIDYLEYLFIKHFKGAQSDYILENTELRGKEPNITDFERPTIESFFNQIVFLLACQGVSTTKKTHLSKLVRYYKPKRRFNASIFIEDGCFILSEGSEIRYPLEAMKEWKNKKRYPLRKKRIDDLIANDKAILLDNGIIKTTTNLSFGSPTAPAILVSGGSENGWDFWVGLSELRDKGIADE